MTWHLGVVGSPIEHSLSPRLHQAALDALGLIGSSEALDVSEGRREQLGEILLTHDALSVTMPQKQFMVKFCDELDDVAQRIGVVNSVLKRNGRVLGRSTDGAGFLDAVGGVFNIDVQHQNVVVLGAGGASRSVVDALAGASAQQVAVIARDGDRARAWCDQYSVVVVNPVEISDVAVTVNTVPFVAGQTVTLSMPHVEYLDGAAAMDIVYSPVETPWLASERTAGRRGTNGLAMLVHQAHHQLEWWFESPIDVKQLFAAVSP